MKITLKNLGRATKQQIADQVVQHMLDQGEKSSNSAVCAYRNNNGLMCAAGCLMTDEEYNPEWDRESLVWDELVYQKGVKPRNKEFIGELQCIHDGCSPSDWQRELMALCRANNLDFNYTPK